MALTLSQNCYGKSSVRVAKVTRHADHHDLKEVAVNVELAGAFEPVYSEGDNRTVLPTDTMKNTVYALAKKHAFHTAEEFGLTLAQYFIAHNAHITSTRIELREILWQRIPVAPSAKAEALPSHAFVSAGREQHTCCIAQSRDRLTIESGLKDLLILKTTGSGFSDFLHDQYTTLQDTNDRILATNLEAKWRYQDATCDFGRCHDLIRQALLESFARHHSLSVQHTLYAMGEAALEKCREIVEIHLVMPNKHYLLFDLARFGLENQNEIFVPTDEPYGRIEGTLRRD